MTFVEVHDIKTNELNSSWNVTSLSESERELAKHSMERSVNLNRVTVTLRSELEVPKQFKEEYQNPFPEHRHLSSTTVVARKKDGEEVIIEFGDYEKVDLSKPYKLRREDIVYNRRRNLLELTINHKHSDEDDLLYQRARYLLLAVNCELWRKI